MISRRIVKRPRKKYYCCTCEKPIIGPHVYAYGGEDYAIDHKPQGIRICSTCALSELVTDEFREFAEKELKPVLLSINKVLVASQ